MMNRIWAFLIIISFVCAVATGRMEALSQGILEGTGSAVNLVISTMGMMCLWTGFMNIAKKSGMTTCLARLFSPVLNQVPVLCRPGGCCEPALLRSLYRYDL